jgi:hypothetical protein
MFRILEAAAAAVVLLALFFVGTVFTFFAELAIRVTEEN